MVITFEIFPSSKLKLQEIPSEWDLTITATQSSISPTIETYRSLNNIRHTPHISAALIQDEAHARKLADVVRHKVFLIGGDREAQGPFERSAQLIPYFLNCNEIGVGGYPEGHPSYEYEELGDEILQEKEKLGATYIATQMAFKPQAIIDWVKQIRRKNITLPVYAGIAAPISVPKLTEFAIRVGVNTSLDFIKKMSISDAAKMMQRYNPEPLMEEISDHVDGFHIYTFNAIKTTIKWVDSIPWLSDLIKGGSSS